VRACVRACACVCAGGDEELLLLLLLVVVVGVVGAVGWRRRRKLQRLRVRRNTCTRCRVEKRANTFNNGSLGSCIDEERSNVRKVMRIA
jgi:hypothetical protein